MNALNQYQLDAGRTDKVPDPEKITTEQLHLVMLTMGLVGEAGEVDELVKKHVFHGKPLDRQQVKKELGDVLWYVARAAAAHGFSLAEVAGANIHKLRVRYPEGFTEEASKARVDLLEEK